MLHIHAYEPAIHTLLLHLSHWIWPRPTEIWKCVKGRWVIQTTLFVFGS